AIDLLFGIIGIGLPPDRAADDIGQHVDPAPGGDRLANEALRLGVLAEIGEDHRGFDAGGLELADGLDGAGRDPVRDNHLGAFGAETPCRGAADPLAGAGDDADLVLKTPGSRRAGIELADHASSPSLASFERRTLPQSRGPRHPAGALPCRSKKRPAEAGLFVTRRKGLCRGRQTRQAIADSKRLGPEPVEPAERDDGMNQGLLVEWTLVELAQMPLHHLQDEVAHRHALVGEADADRAAVMQRALLAEIAVFGQLLDV